MAQSFGNALAPDASVRVDVILDFGAEGKADLGALIRTLEMQLPAGIKFEARFAAVSEA